MNKEEFLKLMTKIPKVETNSCVSTFNSISVEDLANAVDRFKRIPNYNDLLKENINLKQALNEIRELSNNWGKEDYEGGDCYDLANEIKQIIDKSLEGSK